MPRKSRIQSGTGVYHVMMRGINRQRISCLEYEDERSRSLSDDQVMLYLFEEFGISDGQL